jgi:peptidoglycan DL-endopeptidase CwlO
VALPPARTSALSRAHLGIHIRRTVIGVTATALALVSILSPGLPAVASPSAAQIEAQVTALNNQIEKLVEQYNGATVKLQADKVKQAELQKQIGPAEQQAALAQQQISRIAATVYMTGPHRQLQTMVSGASTDDILDALGALDQMAKSQAATVDGASAMLSQVTVQQAPINALVAKEQVQVATLAAEKKKIEAQLVTEQKLQAQAEAAAAAAAAAAKAAKPASSGGSTTSSSSGTYTKAQLMPHACPASSGSGAGYTAAVKACSLIWRTGVSRYPTSSGKHAWVMYNFAEASEANGYDCSGLTMVAWKAAGVSLLHYTGDQWNETTSISKADLKPGDLIFYNDGNHVVMYVGGGWVVQAEHTGAPIKMSAMTFETPVSGGYRRVKQ